MPTAGAAVQVTDRTVPAAASRSSRAVQPGMTSVRADATLGSATLNSVVRAPFSDSPGTWKVSTDVLPGAASSASTWTWAEAGAGAEEGDGHGAAGGGGRDEGARGRPGSGLHGFVAFCVVSGRWSVGEADRRTSM